MAPRPKKTPSAKRKPRSTSRAARTPVTAQSPRDFFAVLEEIRAQNQAHLETARQFAVVVEDMRAQNRATIEAVLGLRDEMKRERAIFLERFERVDNAILKLSSDVVVLKVDVRELKTDVAVLKSDVQGLKVSLARVETKVDGKADVSALLAVDARVGAIESSARSA